MPAQLDVIAERYVVESIVGRGTATEVWAATDKVLGRRVAVKMSADAEDDDFIDAARNAARLSHPNVVAIYDTGRGGGGATSDYVVMELCNATLESLTDARPLDVNRAIDAGLAIARALDAAHAADLIHGDLRPSNVLLSDDGRFKVGDFSGKAGSTRDPRYASPEARAGAVGRHSDIYAMGAVLCHALTGRPPPESGSFSVRTVRPEAPKALDAVVRRCMASDPAQRFDSAAEAATALERLVPQAPAGAQPVRNLEQDEPSSGSELRWIRQVAAVIVVGAAAALALALAIEDPPGDSTTDRGTRGAQAVDIARVSDFDPGGDGSEHPEAVLFVTDGNDETEWRSEQYEGTLEQVKSCCKGVGLLFDLGRPTTVTAIELVTSTPGFRFDIRAADTTGATERSFGLVESGTAAARSTVEIAEAAARYWLVWVTHLPGASASVAISEVTFAGR